MKVIWKGNVFNPTGIATANREIVKELVRQGAEVQCSDIWNDGYDFNKGLEYLNKPINAKDCVTIFADYPQFWRDGYGKIIGHFIHEGTKLFPEWPAHLNKAEKLFVPSEATKNLFKWNNVTVPIEIINYGTNPEIYKPKESEKNENFVFLSVNPWTGGLDRKGTSLMIKAFDEEFKENEKVKLILKIGTFWDKGIDYGLAIHRILGHTNKNIMWNSDYVSEEELATYYQKADCFVAPIMGESFGLTLLNSMACGLPLIVTRDRNSGHMDFCKGKDSVLWIDAPEVMQGDPRFFVEGNMQAKPEIESIKKQMRYAFEHPELKQSAIKNSEEIRTKFTWAETARKIMEFVK